jgi:hypothetical protein
LAESRTLSVVAAAGAGLLTGAYVLPASASPGVV